jgi:hypothetical protein
VKKKRQVKVARTEMVYDDNFNIVGERVEIVPISEMLSRSEAFAELEGLGPDWLIRKYKRDGEVHWRDLLGVLAGIKRLNAVMPLDLLDVIGSHIAGEANWLRAQNRERQAGVRAKHQRWKDMADEIKQRHPLLKGDSRVAEAIAEMAAQKYPDEKAAARTIRGVIRRQK